MEGLRSRGHVSTMGKGIRARENQQKGEDPEGEMHKIRHRENEAGWTPGIRHNDVDLCVAHKGIHHDGQQHGVWTPGKNHVSADSTWDNMSAHDENRQHSSGIEKAALKQGRHKNDQTHDAASRRVGVAMKRRG